MSTDTHHIATMLISAWGHTVSYIHIACQMLKANPNLVVTMMQHNILVAQMETELMSSLPFSPEQVQVVFGETVAGWLETIAKLAVGSEGWPKPRTVHLDFMGGGFVVDQTKEILGPDAKMVMWFSSAVVSMPAQLTDYDFSAIADEIFADEARRKGRSRDEICRRSCLQRTGKTRLQAQTTGMVVKLPGAPDMYDYERWAYGCGAAEGIGLLLAASQKFARVTDGYIAPSTSCLEPVGLPYWKELCRERGQEFFPVGLQTHEACWKDDFESSFESPTNPVVKTFLNDAVSKYGPKSVLYISFGSLFFPVATPGHIAALIDTLLSLPTPFPSSSRWAANWHLSQRNHRARQLERPGSRMRLLGRAARNPPERRSRVVPHARGIQLDGRIPVPGIPLIIWPTNAEQPVNAALLSQEPSPVAIELLQVRAGAQLGPSLRYGPEITGRVEDATKEFVETFEKARGERGRAIAQNAVKMAKALREARKGEAAAEIKRLAAF
ncbi:hypothetical protein FB45DRAFT_1004251 [Roridomyces roridus]|uniref:Glycosyltransferase n=1 Tax=Roridomyces roridus TaxID=1738132 RepID=A0AAD7BRI5_9AGAR|nr:hypothetical protein FB45DRAFT_1004251 [Roridomyces roridus]